MTTENNKLIAEFMGIKELITESQFLAMEHKAHNPTIIEYLKYNTDWNGLMEVVEKIEKLTPNNRVINFGISNVSISIFLRPLDVKIYSKRDADYSVEEIVSIETKGKKIEAVYSSCIEFIKWYNENKI
jgi:hypothetical protein